MNCILILFIEKRFILNLFDKDIFFYNSKYINIFIISNIDFLKKDFF